jgi:hypothetical protein
MYCVGTRSSSVSVVVHLLECNVTRIAHLFKLFFMIVMLCMLSCLAVGCCAQNFESAHACTVCSDRTKAKNQRIAV